MAISTYTELQAAIAEYMARTDLTARIPDFITLAESHFNRELRAREMAAVGGGALSSGLLALPSDFIEWMSAEWIPVGGSTRAWAMRYCEPDSEQWRFRYRPNGYPEMFTIVSGSLVVRPIVAGNIVLAYYQAIPPLASNSTNWLLTKCPDLYLYRSLAEAYIYQKNDTKAAELLALAADETTKATKAADVNKVSQRPNVKPPGDDTGTA